MCNGHCRAAVRHPLDGCRAELRDFRVPRCRSPIATDTLPGMISVDKQKSMDIIHVMAAS